MKKNTIFLVLAILFVGGMITGCLSSSPQGDTNQEQVQNARDGVTAANRDLDMAIQDSIEQYQRESESTFSQYERRLAEYKANISSQRAEYRHAYEQKWSELDRKNRAMKRKLSEYKDTGRDTWKSFKNEFNHDMSTLGHSISDFFTTDNK